MPLTDVSIDPAGDVWAANNWNLPKAAMASAPDPRFSTWGGGSGLTVIYGVAAPVKPPRKFRFLDHGMERPKQRLSAFR